MPDPWKAKPLSVITGWVDAIDSFGRGVTNWELNQFLPTIRAYLVLGRQPSQEQERILEDIYARCTK